MKVAIVSIVVVIALLLGVALPAYLAPNDLAGCQAPDVSTKCAHADAIVAISGGDTSARQQEAVKLYKAGWASTLIFSGAASDKSGPSNAAVMAHNAEKDGVSADHIILDEASDTTSENARDCARIFTTHSIKRVILVTSGYHQQRASLEFKKAVAGTVVILSHPVQSDNQWSNWWWATPVGWWLSVSELVKIIGFYMGLSS